MNNDNFFSIDRLVEFGLGIGVAQQMVKSMNHALANTYVPGPMSPMGAQRVPNTYFVVLDGKPAGPFSEEQISRLITEGKVTKTTYVWKPGMVKWELTENVPDVLKLVALSPPPFNPEG
jgi:hypothetical protein